MRKTNGFLLTLFLTGSLGIYSCGNQGTETSETEEGMIEKKASEEKASPLRSDEGKIGNAEVKVQYGSPSVKDRVIWGDLLPYDEVWRTGANEATFVEFSEDVTVEGEPLKAGKYSLFTVPKQTGSWTAIFNKEWELEHGHYQYKEEHDALRVEVTPEWEESVQENLEITVEDNGLLVRWDKLSLPIHIQ